MENATRKTTRELAGAEVSLPTAAQMLKQSGQVVRDRIFRGELEGEQRSNGRWFVTVASVNRALKQMEGVGSSRR